MSQQGSSGWPCPAKPDPTRSAEPISKLDWCNQIILFSGYLDAAYPWRMSNERERVISITLSESEWQAFVARQPQPGDRLRERIRDEVRTESASWIGDPGSGDAKLRVQN